MHLLRLFGIPQQGSQLRVFGMLFVGLGFWPPLTNDLQASPVHTRRLRLDYPVYCFQIHTINTGATRTALLRRRGVDLNTTHANRKGLLCNPIPCASSLISTFFPSFLLDVLSVMAFVRSLKLEELSLPLEVPCDTCALRDGGCRSTQW